MEFVAPAEATKATLRFEGVDYYAKVWLNEKLLGEHEGYSEPFEFEVARTSKTLRLDAGNTDLAADLTVNSPKPWNTWDRGGPSLHLGPRGRHFY